MDRIANLVKQLEPETPPPSEVIRTRQRDALLRTMALPSEGHTRRMSQGVPATRRRAMLVAGSTAAALVLLFGVGVVTGLVHVNLSSPSSEPVLTAVTGCSQLEQVDGTLKQGNGTSLVIRTASDRPVTVTTTASTFVSLSGALRSDITDGASVMVRGHSSDGTIQAAIVTVGQPFSAVNPPGFVPLRGTVSDASTAGFTLVTSTGTRVPVSVSGGTLVVVPHASLEQLPAGIPIVALGNAEPNGTLSASALTAVLPLSAGPHLHVHVSVKNCSPSSCDWPGARFRWLIRPDPWMGAGPHWKCHS
jgi:hypothetical protein